jgi:hypothetical protein
MEIYISNSHNTEILFKEYYKKVDSNNLHYSIFQTIIPNVSSFGSDLLKFLEIICSQLLQLKRR